MLSTTIIVFNSFYQPINSVLAGKEMSVKTAIFANVWSEIKKKRGEVVVVVVEYCLTSRFGNNS